MRKLFFLIPAMLLSLAMSAATHEIGSGTSNILGTTVAAAAENDVIILTDDTDPYVNKYGDDYTRLEKSLTIQAGEGVHPVVKYEVPFRSRYGHSVKFIGITFDGSSLSHYDFYFRCYSNDDNNLEFENCEFLNCSKYIFQVYAGMKAGTLKFKNCRFHDNTNRGILNQGTIDNLLIDGCEFSNFTGNPVIDNYTDATIGKIKINGSEFFGNTQYMINGIATSHADSCIITNCYVHNNAKSFVYFRASTKENVETCDGIIISNSTFENNDFSSISYSLIDINFAGTPATDDTQVLVDHCTFYNCPVTNSDYAAVKIVATHPLVSNCIFALEQLDVKNCRAIHMQDGREVRNCLTYNYVKDSNWGIRSGVTKTNCIKDNPLFNDLANHKYTYAGEYPLNVSPARGAATDGSDLGDPRWYTEATYPSTDFATPGYYCNGSHATLSTSDIAYESNNNYIRYIDAKNPGTATWIINATRACYIQATLNLADNSSHSTSQKHIFQVQVFDKDNNEVGSVEEGPAWTGDGFTEYNTDKTLAGCIYIPEAGQYTIQLLNNREHSKCGIYGVTLTYAGGDFVTIPSADPIPFADAILSEKATRSLSPAEIHFGSPNAAQYAQWNAHASAGLYDITFTFTGTNHGIYQLIIKQGNNTIFSDTKGQGGSGSVSFESVMIPADGDYVIQVANINPGADGYLTSVTAAAAALADAWIIDDEATTEDDIEAHKEVKYIPILKRSFVAGMYNTICVPFDSYDSELTSIFGAGYELLALESATLTDGVLVLNFQTVAGNSFAAGTPYLIKPTQDVVNPQFSKHTIHMYASNHVQHGGAADFIGTYIQKQLNADYDLFLGQNNILHFPSSTSAPLKGLRAYFHVTAASAQAIKRARIVTREEVITEIDLVNGENNGVIKTIENGQLIINLDGIRYNIMGGKIK